MTDVDAAVAALPPEARDVINGAVSKLMQSEDMRVLMLRAEAIEAQQRAAGLFDEADRLEYVAALREAARKLTRAADDLAETVDDAATAVKTAIEAERASEDRYRAAAENHRLAAEAERTAQRDHADPAAQTDSLLRLRASADIEAREHAAYEGAKAARVNAERELADARARMAHAEDAERTALAAVENPGTAAISVFTAAADGLRRVSMGAELGDEAMGIVRGILADIAIRTGIARGFAADERARLEREQFERATARILPKPGHPLRPSSAVFAPPGIGPAH